MTRLDTSDHVGSYESYEVGIRPIVLFVAALAAATLVILLLMRLVHVRLLRGAGSAPASPHALAEGSETPPEPRLQDAPARDLAALRARENKLLSSYGWGDRSSGVARGPIERAMELVAKEGLPARSGGGR